MSPFHRPCRFPFSGSRRAPRGFTLVEILIATTIAGIVSASLVSIIFQALKIYDYDDKKITVNRYIRDFTTELAGNATFANYALIFPDFSTRAKVSPVFNPDTGEIDTAGINVPAEDGQSGDMLVLVFVDPANDERIQRIVGYYRDAPPAVEVDPDDDTAKAGPVRRFELNFNPSSASSAVNLLPAISTINTWPEVIELSEGLSDGRLFHNFYGRSIMVNGEIIQRGDRENDGKKDGFRVARNTYNFTVSPRG